MLTMGDLIRLQDEFGDLSTPKAVAAVLHAALVRDDPDLTREAVADLMPLNRIKYVGDRLALLYGDEAAPLAGAGEPTG
jgi:hypothetical protein